MLELFIAGVPRPQGSKNAYKRGTRVVMVEANKHLPEWRQAVYEALRASGKQFEGAVTVMATFYLPRPKTNKRLYATTKPDVDKLQRAIGDCLTKAGTIIDDSYIVTWNAAKAYADGVEPGVRILVEGCDTP
jgi:Holliday junction resolvase RusA-like endonuclease